MNKLTPVALQVLKNDISRIEEALRKKENLEELHMEIDGKYQRFFPNWGNGMYGYIPNMGFHYEQISPEHNLKMMQNKLKGLEAYPYFESKNEASTNISPVFNNSVEVEVEIGVKFKEARSTIEKMSSLTESDVQEILGKIDALEEIVNSKERKTKKWDNAKEIIKWMADKSADVGIAFLPLLMQIN